MSKSSIMAVISLLFMIFTLIIMSSPKLALVLSVILWLGSAGYSAFIFIKERNDALKNDTLKKEGNSYEK